MMTRAYQDGALAASKRFGVREASISQWLAGLALPMATRAGLNVMMPKLMPTVEKSFEMPFQALKNTGGALARGMRGPSSPAEALMQGLSNAPAPGALRDPGSMISRLAGGKG